MDQRRADTLVDLLLGRAEPAEVSLQVIVAADTLAGASHEPGWVPGLGPVTATEIGELVGPWTDTGLGLAGERAAVADRPGHRDPHRCGPETLPAVRGVGPGRPRQRCDLPVPRLPPLRRQLPAPTSTTPSPGQRPHIGGQPGGAVPAAPPPQTHRRMERSTRPHRRDDLDHPHRTPYKTHPWQYTNPHPPPDE